MAIGTALMIGSAVLGYSSSRRQAKAEARYRRALQIQRNEHYVRMAKYQQELSDFQNKRYEFTAESAKKDADQQYSTVLEQLGQRKKQAFDRIAQYEQKAYETIGRMNVSRESTAGNSVLAATQAALVKAARQVEITQDDYEGKIAQGNRQFNAIQAQAANRINAAMPSPLQPLAPPDQLQGTYIPGTGDLLASVMGAVGSSYISGGGEFL